MNVDFSNLTKEQKQYVLLGIIGVGAIGYGIFYGVSNFGGTLSSTKTQLEELNDKIDRAERELGRRAKTMDDFDQTITVLESHFDNLPPEENYYSWATEIVYAKGRNAGLKVESVDEIAADSRQAKKLKDPVYFETYALRITARGGYEETKAFIKDIEDNHPLVRFTGVEISKGNDPEMHSVQLFVQWPHKLQRIADLWKDQHRRPEMMVVKTEPKAAPKSAPEVEKSEPKPEPVVVKSEPRPEVKKPTPVVVKAPAPKPVQKPDTVVAKKPTPPAPRPESVVATPEAVVKPKFKPELKPQPKAVVKAEPQPVVRAPVVEEPKPVVAEKKPEPKPEPVIVKVDPKPVIEDETPVPAAKPAPVVEEFKPVPVVEEPSEPAPVFVKTPEPKVEPKPAPVVTDAVSADEDHVLSILASIDQVESGDVPKEDSVSAVESEMTSLLASLDSNGVDSKPEPVQKTASSDADDLENYLTQLAAQSETPGPAEPAIAGESAVVTAPVVAMVQNDEPASYVSTSKSAKILEELLMQGKPKTSKSLGSFLDGMVGDINESR